MFGRVFQTMFSPLVRLFPVFLFLFIVLFSVSHVFHLFTICFARVVCSDNCFSRFSCFNSFCCFRCSIVFTFVLLGPFFRQLFICCSVVLPLFFLRPLFLRFCFVPGHWFPRFSVLLFRVGFVVLLCLLFSLLMATICGNNNK